MSNELDLPVLVGVGTAHQRGRVAGDGVDCTALIIDAVRRGVADCGTSALAAKAHWIGATRGLSDLPDVGRRVAEALAVDAFTVAADVGIPQHSLVNQALEAIRTRSAEVAIVCGGESKHRDDLARRSGLELARHDQAGLVPDLEMTREGEIIARPEIEIGAVDPVKQYAMIDNARRYANGWSIEEHRDDIATLWHRFNKVSRMNPRADFGDPMSREEIRDPTPTNRPIAWPYNKWHSSQWSVDQAAALVFCSVAVAAELGIPRELWVYPHVGIESSFSLSLSRRAELHRWPAMSALGDAAAAHVGRPIREIDHVELYSCFPAAVRVQQAELALAPAETPTLTGGMTFAGGPFNNFVYQATVNMIERLRAEPGSVGAVTAVSGFLTKPALALWSTTAPQAGLLLSDLADDARAATGEVPLVEDPDGPGTVATYTVGYAGPNPARVCAIVDLESGGRAVAAVDDDGVARSAVAEELIGTRVRVAGRSLSV